MTRAEKFAELARLAPGRLPWGVEYDGDLGFGYRGDLSYLEEDAEDTDDEAAVFIVWALEWLRIQRPRATLRVEHFREGIWRIAFGRSRIAWGATMLDATLDALLAVLRAMEEQK